MTQKPIPYQNEAAVRAAFRQVGYTGPEAEDENFPPPTSVPESTGGPLVRAETDEEREQNIKQAAYEEDWKPKQVSPGVPAHSHTVYGGGRISNGARRLEAMQRTHMTNRMNAPVMIELYKFENGMLHIKEVKNATSKTNNSKLTMLTTKDREAFARRIVQLMFPEEVE